MQYRKHFYFKRNREIGIELAGWRQTPYLSFRVDGSESEIQFHIALFLGIWITFSRFIPDSWFPKRLSLYGHGWLSDERAFRIYWFESAIWWNFWMREDEWDSTDPKWRRNSIHFDRLIKGKHTVKWNELARQKFLLPFFEGAYEVEVIKKERIDSWQRWFTRKSITFEVECAKGIPHEGKGENSYDCDEDATYAISFGISSSKGKSMYGAALMFWEHCMRDRERYGSPKWTPAKFCGKDIQMAE